MKRLTENEKQYIIFSNYLRRNISLATWYRIKAVMLKNQIMPTEDNLKFIAALRNEFSNSKISFNQLLKVYIKIEKDFKFRQQVKGAELLEHLDRVTLKVCPKNTLYRWFKSLQPDINGYYFSKDRIYSKQEILHVFLKAFIYREKHLKKYNLKNKSLFSSLT